MRRMSSSPAALALGGLVALAAAMGIGRSVLGTHVTADASRIAAADLEAMPVLVLGVER